MNIKDAEEEFNELCFQDIERRLGLRVDLPTIRTHRQLTFRRGLLLLKLIKDLNDYLWATEELLKHEKMFSTRDTLNGESQPHLQDIGLLQTTFRNWYEHSLITIRNYGGFIPR
jgi:hypothetical protein